MANLATTVRQGDLKATVKDKITANNVQGRPFVELAVMFSPRSPFFCSFRSFNFTTVDDRVLDYTSKLHLFKVTLLTANTTTTISYLSIHVNHQQMDQHAKIFIILVLGI